MFKSRLNQIMKSLKISGKELSLATEISESTISKFLSGNREPKYSQMIKLAEAFNFPPEMFMAAVSTKFESHFPIINEFYMVRDIYNEKYSNLIITTFHAFKDFVLDIEDVLDKDALYISLILEGKIENEIETLKKGDYRVNRGSTMKNTKATISKDTRIITLVISDKVDNLPENWSEIIFKNLKSHKK